MQFDNQQMNTVHRESAKEYIEFLIPRIVKDVNLLSDNDFAALKRKVNRGGKHDSTAEENQSRNISSQLYVEDLFKNLPKYF